MKEEKFRRLISEHEKELENSGNKRPEGPSSDRKKAACWCCGESTHRRDKCPNRDKAFCNKCNTRGHFDRACTRRGVGQKRQRSATPTRAEEETSRHSSQNRASTPRTAPSRRSADDNSRLNITTKRVACRQSKQMPKWEGLTRRACTKQADWNTR